MVWVPDIDGMLVVDCSGEFLNCCGIGARRMDWLSRVSLRESVESFNGGLGDRGDGARSTVLSSDGIGSSGS